MSPRRPRDAGMVTAEIAVALPALVLVLAVSVWAVRIASIQVACTDAARSGARAAARGEPLPAVRAMVARALPPGAQIKISRDAETTRVEIAVPTRPPAASGLPPLLIRAEATAATEPGAAHQPATEPHEAAIEPGASMNQRPEPPQTSNRSPRPLPGRSRRSRFIRDGPNRRS